MTALVPTGKPASLANGIFDRRRWRSWCHSAVSDGRSGPARSRSGACERHLVAGYCRNGMGFANPLPSARRRRLASERRKTHRSGSTPWRDPRWRSSGQPPTAWPFVSRGIGLLTQSGWFRDQADRPGHRRRCLVSFSDSRISAVAFVWPGPPCPSPFWSTAPNGLFKGLIWPKTGFASTDLCSTVPLHFLPLSAAPPFLAETRKSPAAVRRCAGPCRVSRRSPSAL